jgi:predicted MFS family arabinose efflux permease
MATSLMALAHIPFPFFDALLLPPHSRMNLTIREKPGIRRHRMTAPIASSISGGAGRHREAGEQSAMWGGVFAMTLCVFALISSEFMPVSLLTPMARDLLVSEGLAGQGIAISGAFAVFTSLSISAIAGSMNRKSLLLGLTALMAISGAIVALAPNYLLYMVGRALVGVVVGGFWSLSAATAIRLVPSHDVPRALAIFNGGNALATVVAAPFGSYLGSVIGWRGAFFCLVPVALMAFIWQWISLPSMPSQAGPARSRHVFTMLRDPKVALGMLAVSMLFMGQFGLFTYVRPFLETVTRVDISTLSLVLLVIGVGGFIGTTVISRFLQWNFYRTLTLIPMLMALIAVALTIFGSNVAAVAALLGIWGLVATAAPVGWWSWLAKTLPQDAEAGGGLMVAVVQLAIALGSTIGGDAPELAFASNSGQLIPYKRLAASHAGQS